MKKILFLIPLQLSLIFPNILMTEINQNYSKNSVLSNKNTKSYIGNTLEEQVMFNWEQDDIDNNKTSYGYYTKDDLLQNPKSGLITEEGLNFNYEFKIGITNKTNTYYTNQSFDESDYEYQHESENFEKNYNFKREIETLRNYYGIGFELEIKKIQKGSKKYNILENNNLYIGQKNNQEDTIENYQKAQEYYDSDNKSYYFYYDNWSGMMQDQFYLDFLLVNENEQLSTNYNSSKTNNLVTYDSKQLELYDKPITENDIYNKTNIKKDIINKENNSFGITYDDVDYYDYTSDYYTYNYDGEIKHKEYYSYSTSFNLKWNSQRNFWEEYFYYENNYYNNSHNLYFNAIYEIPITHLNWSEPKDVVLLTRNNEDYFRANSWRNNPNVEIRPEQNIRINYDLYKYLISPDTDDYDYIEIFPYILGYYDQEREFHPFTLDSNLTQLDRALFENIEQIGKPTDIQFLLSNSGNDYSYEEDIQKYNEIYEYNENFMNQTIIHNSINTSNKNVYEFPGYSINGSSGIDWNSTGATGYQNAFFIPEWDNVNHPKEKDSLYWANFSWFIISTIIGITILIIYLLLKYLKKNKISLKWGQN